MEMGDFRQELRDIRQDNNFIASLFSRYVGDFAGCITTGIMDVYGAEGAAGQEDFYRILLARLCGIDPAKDSRIYGRYWNRAIHRLDPEAYLNDPYYANINIPCRRSGNWELLTDSYAPFEAFVCRDITVTSSLEEIPHIGYFDKEFRFPAVHQEGREWMAVKPNEIETMRFPLETVSGKVATLGLGLGYFTYMASLKDNVESITVIERDRNAIELFRQVILPQFPYRDKVHIVEADAFRYVEKQMPDMDFDYVFADLWHDALDGMDMYLRLKRLERKVPHSRFLYWIETSILSRLRWHIFDAVLSSCRTREEAIDMLSDKSLRGLACGFDAKMCQTCI